MKTIATILLATVIASCSKPEPVGYITVPVYQKDLDMLKQEQEVK